MTSSWKHVTQRMSLALSSVLLVVLLAACGGSGSTGNNVTPTPKPANTPTPTTPAVAMQTYTGTGFSISYPQGVQETASGNQVTFLDPVSKNVMTIATAANPAGAQGTSTAATASMQIFEKSLLSNAQPATAAPTVTVGGESWVQLSATGDLAITDPGTPGTLIQLADTHNGTLYEIVYYGPTATFAQSNTLAFQPMLQSFKFTA